MKLPKRFAPRKEHPKLPIFAELNSQKTLIYCYFCFFNYSQNTYLCYKIKTK